MPLILALVAVQSGFFAVASSARGAIIPRIVPVELVPAANTLTFTVGNVGQVIGPLIAGVLVTRQHGFAYAYGVDAALFTLAHVRRRRGCRRSRRTASRPGPGCARCWTGCGSSAAGRCC